MPSVLSRYIARQYLAAFIGLFTVLGGVLFLFELLELLRRASERPSVTLAVALDLALLKLPSTLEAVFPFAVLFSAMFTFWRLTRSQELVVARAAGISVWQFMAPILLVAALIGVVRTTLVNPLSAGLYAAYERLEDRYINGRSDTMDISRGGIWLRQRDDQHGVAVIYAASTRRGAIELRDVVIFRYDADNHYVGRIDAATAALRDGYWQLTDALVTERTGEPRPVGEMRLPSDLTPARIQESFASPRTMSFWNLPEFIATLRATGFSTTQHRLQYESLLAQPLLLAAMVLLAAAFTLRHHRRGGTFALVVGGVTAGFVLFFGLDVLKALGSAETIPVALAAWAPAGVALLLGCATLLHIEEG